MEKIVRINKKPAPPWIIHSIKDNIKQFLLNNLDPQRRVALTDNILPYEQKSTNNIKTVANWYSNCLLSIEEVQY